MTLNKSNESVSSLTTALATENDDLQPTTRRPTMFDRLLRRQTSTVSDSSSGSNKNSESPRRTDVNRSRENSLPPLSQLSLNGYRSSTKRRLLDEELAGNIRNLLPARLQLFDEWELVYSMEQHGISLNTLYQNSNPEYQLQQHRKKKYEAGYGDSVISSMISGGSNTFNERKRPQGYVLIIKDENNCKFGCYMNENLKPSDQKRYYGNGECFLWKCEFFTPHNNTSKENLAVNSPTHTRFKAFMYTGINDNIIYSNHNFIAIGSSNGQNGLWIDKSLYKGVSYSCETFGNEILNEHKSDSKIGKFKIMGLELWRVGTVE